MSLDCWAWFLTVTDSQIAFTTNTIMAAIAVCVCLVLRFCLKRENRLMNEAEESAETEEELEQARSRIRYVL